MNLHEVKDLLPGRHIHGQPYYRIVRAGYRDKIDEISGAFLHGGRYNPKMEFGVLYLAKSESCALKEKIMRATEIAYVNLVESVIGRFNVNIHHVLDLTNETVLSKIAVNPRDLLEIDYSIPQSISREARAVGFEALLVPSAVDNSCANLVIFKDRLAISSYCKIEKIQLLEIKK